MPALLPALRELIGCELARECSARGFRFPGGLLDDLDEVAG